MDTKRRTTKQRTYKTAKQQNSEITKLVTLEHNPFTKPPLGHVKCLFIGLFGMLNQLHRFEFGGHLEVIRLLKAQI